MPTPSENQNNNPSEYVDNIPTQLTDNVLNNYTYTPNINSQGPITPNFLLFQNNVSNGYLSRVAGITDFVAYNDYIHYTNPTLPVKRFNVFNSLIKSAQRFEIYSRQYRI